MNIKTITEQYKKVTKSLSSDETKTGKIKDTETKK